MRTPFLLLLSLSAACHTRTAAEPKAAGSDTAGDTAPGPVDADGDGYDATVDCDDADPSVHPDATEACNGLDDDCDGLVDDADDDLDLATAEPYWTDADGDGYGDPATEARACDPPAGAVGDGTDCDDADPAVHPGADELCDGVDDDCDDALPTDEGDSDGDGLLDCEDPVDGTALEFAEGAYLYIPGSEDLHLAEAHTLEAWFRTDVALASGENAVIGKHYCGYYNSWFLGFNSYYGTEHAAQYYVGGPRMTGTVSLNDGDWHHIAGTFDGSTAILYVDGVEVDRASYSPGATNSLPITIGGHGAGVCAGSYNGILDEVRIWSVARSAEQIAESMSGPLSGDEEGLVAWFDFNDGSGQVATDRSGNGWDAVLGSSADDADADPVWVEDAPY